MGFGTRVERRQRMTTPILLSLAVLMVSILVGFHLTFKYIRLHTEIMMAKLNAVADILQHIADSVDAIKDEVKRYNKEYHI